MPVRSEPSDGRALDKARGQAGIVSIRVAVGRFAPGAVVPLADAAAPILNRQFGLSVAGAEACALISVSRRGEEIQAIEAAGRKGDSLAVSHDGIGLAGFRRGKLKVKAGVGNLSGEHLGGQRTSLRVESADGFAAIRTGHGTIKGERNRPRLRDREFLIRRSKLHSKSAELIGAEVGYQMAFRERGIANRHFLTGDFAS